MLATVFRKLDAWMLVQSLSYEAEGLAPMAPVEIRVIGQTALLEANLGLALAATRDVDAIATWTDDEARRKLAQLLQAGGKELDPVAHEAWMPQETEYDTLVAGRFVTGLIARPEYVLVSKAKYAPAKNRVLITDYIAAGASPLFFELAERYQVDLEALL